jgi:hypothetical protein
LPALLLLLPQSAIAAAAAAAAAAVACHNVSSYHHLSAVLVGSGLANPGRLPDPSLPLALALLPALPLAVPLATSTLRCQSAASFCSSATCAFSLMYSRICGCSLQAYNGKWWFEKQVLLVCSQGGATCT